MALTDENGGGIPATMLVSPTGGMNNGSGFGDWGGSGFWIILLFILLGNGGWGNDFGGGWGGDGLYPWMNNSQNINNGFRDQMLNDNITSIRDGVYGISNQLCSGFAGTTAAINGAQNALAQQLYTNQISDLERSFAAQTAQAQGFNSVQAQLAQCCCDNRLATQQLQAVVQQENCADRAAVSDGIRDIIVNNTANTQRILDQLCQDKIDAKNDEIAQLRQELLYARGQASQDVQTAALRAGQATTANQLIQELRSCPVPSMPVYGMTPIFTCPQNQGCGCGCNG